MSTPEAQPDSDLRLAIAAALRGAALGLDYFGRVTSLEQESKADGSLVTKADLAVETEIKAVLQRNRPADAFLGEETGEHGTGSRRWILDGIDGTLVFVLGDDRWQSLVALEIDSQIEIGVAVVPTQGEIWFAQRGRGAYVQGFDSSGLLGAPRRLAAGRRTKLTEATVGVLPPVDMVPPEALSEVAAIVHATIQKDWSCHAALLVGAPQNGRGTSRCPRRRRLTHHKTALES